MLRSEQGLADAGANDAALSGACCRHWRGAAIVAGRADERRAFAALQDACKAALPSLKAQLRGQLHYHLGGAALRTRQLMIDMQRLFEPGPPKR